MAITEFLKPMLMAASRTDARNSTEGGTSDSVEVEVVGLEDEPIIIKLSFQFEEKEGDEEKNGSECEVEGHAKRPAFVAPRLRLGAGLSTDNAELVSVGVGPTTTTRA